ncbi:transporter substrate-binding domain-containing protein [Pantoea sp. VH_4]|uniref:histidine kinase n=2 Tax=Erwiniaceae TaxID=1903409 RepID=A0AB34CIE2_9GAMM|nr:transporter substrate-binding domain-containing protein [Pantoea sp. VH_8]KAA5933342.1 transporter substrate-binding domain-containing protein [Pantoea sp. VH_4]KAA5985079.1 transporter substrate-binding domain-containing protein [Pantoea sp. M_4]KAA6122867.1 transporter substrate-binding domain-containing protein [Pantoea gossypiicola]
MACCGCCFAMRWIAFLLLLFCTQSPAAESLQLLAHTQFSLKHPELTQQEWQWIYGKKSLRLAAWKPVNPPYSLIPGRQDYSGIAADYLGIIAATLRLPVTVILYENREEALRALRLGTADVIAFAQHDALFSHLTLSQPWSTSLPVLVSRQGSDASPGTALRIGVDRDDSHAEDEKKRFPSALFIPFDYTRQALEAVTFGNLDLYLGDLITTQYLINQENLKELDVEIRHGVPAPAFSFAAIPDQRNWIVIINKLLSRIPQSTQAEIQQRWRGGSSARDKQELKPHLSQLEEKWLSENPQVTVSVLNDNFPLSYIDQQGQFQGILADVLSAIQKRVGLQFVIRREKKLTDAFAALRQGESEVLAGASLYSAQQQGLLASRAIFYSSRALVISRNAPADILPQRLAYLYGEQPEQKLHEYYPDSHLLAVNRWQEGLDKIVRGEADGMLMPLIVAEPLVNGRYAKQLRLTQGLWHEPLRVVLASAGKQYTLASILDKTLMSLPPEEMNAIISTKQSELPATISARHLPTSLPLGWLPVMVIPWLIALIWLIWRYLRQRKALQQAQHRVQQQNAFLATLSHEIRNPLSAINGMLELLCQPRSATHPDDDALRVAYEATDALLSLTSEILDFTRLEANRLILRPEPVSLRALLESVAAVYESIARQKNLRLLLAIDAALSRKVLADPLRLRQIVTNLLGNAIKFTSAGDILLEALCDEKPDALLFITLRVQDSGAGIDPATAQCLFQPFSQGESESVAQGSGMGLYISRSLARMMGGDIVLHSKPGKGSTFSVTLQLRQLEESDFSQPDVTPSSPSRRSLCVLVVDDQPANRFLLRQQLRWLGHEAIECTDLAQIADDITRYSPELVITDCLMPQQSGFTLTRNLKQRWPHLTIWGISADRDKQTLEAAAEAGMTICLPKPLTLGELQKQLDQLMQPVATLWSPAALPDALLSSTHYLPFLQMQITALDEALTDLACWQQDGQPPLSATLHRLQGGVALLGATQLTSLCQQPDPAPEMLQELISLTRLLRQELAEETTKITDGLTVK